MRIAFIVASEPFEQNATRSVLGTIRSNAFATSISSSVGAAKWNPSSAWAESALTISGWAWPLIRQP